ncbi:MAG: aldo/keto reductase [Acidobacteria bacterium]|nr:aldo/keto reductase [Acidobacteriota bacterium]
MRYKLFGRSGLRVSEFCLGTMTFGKEWGWGADKAECRKIFDAFTDAGGNFIDTANRYTEGTSEKYIGDFLSKTRDKYVISTKYTLNTRKNDPNSAGNHRKNMILSLEASLNRLKTDYIDVYWVHAWDFLTPIDEVMRALDDMVTTGKILYIGISDTPAWIVARANTIAELNSWSRFVGLQIEFSLIQRSPERELLPMAEHMNISITPWAVLGGGILTGKYSEDNNKPKRFDGNDQRLTIQNMKIAHSVVELSKEIDKPPSQIAINWVRQKSYNMVPIIGVRTVDQLKNNVESLQWELTQEELEWLDEISSIELGFPHDYLEKEFVRDLVYGGTYDDIIKPPCKGTR